MMKQNPGLSRKKIWLTLAILALLVAVAAPAGARSGVTERVSLSSSGKQANNSSLSPNLSTDGRFVAFSSFASNLVSEDTNRMQDVFVRDREGQLTERVSVSSSGEQGNKISWGGSISADGRIVAFSSYASNLVEGDTNVCEFGYIVFNCADVFVHDRDTGLTERVSISSEGLQGNGESDNAAISPDGRYVAFTSYASNLVEGDTNGMADVFVHDLETGATGRVSVASDGTQANSSSSAGDISSGGRFVVFNSLASDLVEGDTNGRTDVFVHDRQTGQTVRISVSSSGEQANERSSSNSISADGRFVAFISYATNLVGGDENHSPDAFLHDRQTGQTRRVSLSTNGEQGDNFTWGVRLSADGRIVAMLSDASNLVEGDTNVAPDVFVLDRRFGTLERVSVSSADQQAMKGATGFAISADGRLVAFASQDENLVPGDTNAKSDVFVRDWGIALISYLPLVGK